MMTVLQEMPGQMTRTMTMTQAGALTIQKMMMIISDDSEDDDDGKGKQASEFTILEWFKR